MGPTDNALDLVVHLTTERRARNRFSVRLLANMSRLSCGCSTFSLELYTVFGRTHWYSRQTHAILLYAVSLALSRASILFFLLRFPFRGYVTASIFLRTKPRFEERVGRSAHFLHNLQSIVYHLVTKKLINTKFYYKKT